MTSQIIAFSVPKEVLELIFKFILDEAGYAKSYIDVTDREDSSPRCEFINFLIVCQEWYEVGVRLLYLDIVLAKNSHNFLSAPNMSHLCNARSLTIMLPRNRKNVADEFAAWYTAEINRRLLIGDGLIPDFGPTVESFLEEIPAKIKHMTNLESFSLTVHDPTFGVRSRQECQKRSSLAIDIVNSLSSTTRNLELDTILTTGGPPEHSSDCICSHIAKLIPRLHHLRICVPSLCAHLLVPSTTLRSLVINFAGPDSESNMTLSMQTFLNGFISAGYVQEDQTDGEDASAEYHTEEVATSYDQSTTKWPGLQKFIVIHSALLELGLSIMVRDGNWSTIFMHDFLARNSIAMPVTEGWKCGNYSDRIFYNTIRTPDDSSVDSFHETTGSLQGLMDRVEGNAWATSVQGHRFHKSIRDTTRGKNIRLIADGTSSRTEHLEQPGLPNIHPNLYTLEKRAGRALVYPRI